MTAKTTIDDMLWLRDRIRELPAGDDPGRLRRMQGWVDQAIRVRMAQRTKSKTEAHGALMGAYQATVIRWKAACEQATNAHPGDVELFREAHPMPTFKAFLIGARQIGAGAHFCPLCGSPLDTGDGEDEPADALGRVGFDAVASRA